ncbi:cell division topological specificity factor MinE [Halanaerobium saccharolyticum]|uniref:Cell division topological specificity factor n=1 Tax=Halanaerobium saccharolyticum TaxID=43595 RepID=A0A2T5RRG5_9FIRM|nr:MULTISPECIES: cell division topological specificity factor MinE [Halanaerobium]PTW02744.1 cell division topological specificity factor MinE [Halanaerobium saccharolyticum]PUU93644.1 MAG: cell division topological specificity factor [Halanaerobium sp.]PUU94185.1 MAG: cell division topological specificity factor [Halanaerobium sp.]TDP96843.1 cell division topological specificity factor MinE [Halanaerobium saccharolyticum]
MKSDDKKSKSVAKERLQFVLVQDRVKLTPDEMDAMRDELIGVLSKYIDVDSQKIEMDVKREDDMTALVANFPLKGSK